MNIQGDTRVLLRYLWLTSINAAVVYIIYTPYVFLWVGFNAHQYIRWLEGGLAMSLIFGGLFSLIAIRAGKFFDQRAPAPEMSAPEVPAPEVPAPEVPAPEVPAPEAPA